MTPQRVLLPFISRLVLSWGLLSGTRPGIMEAAQCQELKFWRSTYCSKKTLATLFSLCFFIQLLFTNFAREKNISLEIHRCNITISWAATLVKKSGFLAYFLYPPHTLSPTTKFLFTCCQKIKVSKKNIIIWVNNNIHNRGSWYTKSWFPTNMKIHGVFILCYLLDNIGVFCLLERQ